MHRGKGYMVEVKVKQVESVSKRIKKTTAKTYRGYLEGCLAKARNDKNTELVVLFTELIQKFREYHPDKLFKIEIVEGWKGEGTMEIYKGFENDFIIREWIKDKDGSEASERLVTVRKQELNKILWIIRDMALETPYKCYYVAKKLGYPSWKELWKERKEYFTHYYYPIKVCEALGVIHYSGRGTITRLK